MKKILIVSLLLVLFSCASFGNGNQESVLIDKLPEQQPEYNYIIDNLQGTWKFEGSNENGTFTFYGTDFSYITTSPFNISYSGSFVITDTAIYFEVKEGTISNTRFAKYFQKYELTETELILHTTPNNHTHGRYIKK